METLIINKIAINVLKNDIKKLSEEQKFLRNQRKTVYIKGERTMEPWVAAMKHQANREKLRIMFAAYGLMRGKSFSQIEKNYSEEEHPLKNFLPQISKMIETYNQIENELQK
jgi:hypothetical protein